MALRGWLIKQDPPLANEIFLDTDPDTGLRPGERWKNQLISANSRCEAVICLLSKNWESSPECRTEYRTAENMGKQILCARLHKDTGEYTSEWQHCELWTDGLPEKDVETIAVRRGAPVTFAKKGLHQLREAIRGAGIAAENFVWPPPSQPDRAPYRGWEPFEELDAGVFFGRDAETLRALDKLRGMRTTGVDSLFVVLGPSGSGKSSFLRAGLLPRLRREDRRFVLLDILRPERRALTGDTGLARAIHHARRRLGLTKPPLGDIENACTTEPQQVRALLADIRRAAADRLPESGSHPAPPTLVLPLDQAEELFSSDAGPEASAFLRLITELGRPDADEEHLGLIVAATIRTDRYEGMQSAPELAGLTSEVFDDLKPMPPNQFREVITGPAARASAGGQRLSFAPVLVNRLLEEATEGGDALPLLALTLRRLYDRYGDTGDITLADYQAMGGMRRVVHNVVDEVLSAEPEQRARQLAELRAAFIPWLATIADNDEPVRRVTRWSDLPETSRPLMDAFVEKRLLVKDQRGGQVVVEVALESLLRQWDDLAGWLRDQRDELKAAGALEHDAAAWEAAHRSPDWLLTGTRLADAEELIAKPGYRQRLEPTRDYLAASRQAENQKRAAEEERRQAELQAARDKQATAEKHAAALRKRSRILIAVLTVTAVIAVTAVALGVLANIARNQAYARTREAVALKLTSQAESMLAGVQVGGDVRALQQILAAPSIWSAADTGAQLTAVLARRNTLKIIPTPDRVWGVAFSPDGTRIVSGSADKTVRVWDAGSGEQVGAPLEGHTDRVLGVAFSPDGTRIVSASDDKTVRVWDAGSGEQVGAPLEGHTGPVWGVAFSPDGTRIVSASADKTVRVWDAGSGEQVGAPLEGHTDRVLGVAFSPDGTRIVSASDDKTVRVWDAGSGEQVGAPLEGHTGPVLGVAFSPDGTRIVSASVDKTVRVWDAGSGEQVGAPLEGHTGPVWGVAFSPDGTRIVSASVDKTVRVWDAGSGEQVGAPLEGHTDWVFGVAFSPDGTRIASGSADKTVRVWDAGSGEQVGAPLEGHTGPVWGVAFSPDGTRIASGSADKTVRVWDAGSGEQVGAPLEGHTDAVWGVAFSPDGTRIASGSADKTVRVWDAGSGEQVGAPLEGHTGWVWGVAFSPDGTRIASGSLDKTVRVWDAGSGEQVGAPLEGHTDAVWGVAFSPDGTRIASGSADKTVRVWDAGSGEQVGAPLEGHTGWVFGVAFSPDGARIVSGSLDKTVRVWDAGSGEQVGAPLEGHTDAVWGVAFSPDGTRIVSGSADKTVRVWDAGSGDQVGAPLEGHTGAVFGVAFSRDGTRIASGGNDGTVRVWPGPPVWPSLLCDKLTANMSHRQWNEWVSPAVGYIKVCPDLPVAPD